MSRLLVTGGAGFIGSNFVKYWLANHPHDEVINFDKLTYAGHLSSLKDVMDNPKHHFVQGDIRNPQEVEQAISRGIDIIVHFAAESHVDRSIYGPLEFVTTNAVGTTVLLEVARANPSIRFILVSTDEVYGSLSIEDSSKKFTIGYPYQPRNPYAATKAAADHIARAYSITFGLDVIITNCTNNVGPFQDPEKFIPLSITNILDGKPIRIYGKGQNIRDWIWVLDHVAGIEKAILKGKRGETYLFGGSSEIDNLSLAKKIINKMGFSESDSNLVFVADRPGHDMRYAIDSSKAVRELGWSSKMNIDDILELTIAWYRDNSWWWKPLKDRKEGTVIEHSLERKEKSYG